MKKILVLRFSAMGDVALCLPVIKRALALDSNLYITIATKDQYAFLFENVDRLQVIALDFDKTYKGVSGLVKLSRHLAFKQYDYIIDLHNVLRTHFLRFLMKRRSKLIVFNKGRGEKLAYIKNKVKPLIHTTERYAEAFTKAKCNIDTQFKYPAIELTEEAHSEAGNFFKKYALNKAIGLAPFAAHEPKSIPDEELDKLLTLLLADKLISVFVFAGPAHQTYIGELQQKFGKHIINTASISIQAQIALMSKLDYLITADSANMHFAALQAVPVKSIWGATSSALGFAPLDSAAHQIFEANLACQPCSVFGNKACTNKDKYACFKAIDWEEVIK
jgi:ADP-heptose:LPS heptosyltransferase